MNKQKGFSLVELLVVIAIMAILATIAVASLNSARTKSADTAVQSAMQSLKAQAEIFYDTKGWYNSDGSTAMSINCVGATPATGGVFGDPAVQNIILNIQKNAASGATLTCTTDSLGQKWAVSVNKLKSGGPWCLDNQNNNKASAPAAAGICP